jgi:tRNA A-37 threonylcarbamoyl transferase component Bud32
MSAKRNLLLGMLALQNNFISRDQLLAAFNAWVEDKGQSLGAVLLAQSALSPEHHALLEALANAHLGRHANDPDQSLAAVSTAGTAREDLASIADADVQASLASLPIHRSTRITDGAAATAATVAYPVQAGRFRILRPHAEGGLGQVSIALDQELNREVALKEIKQQCVGDADARARFLLEAEITGALEHPGIVPVYSLGRYADGRPFYAMRFIKGDNLKEAIARFHGRSRLPDGSTAQGPDRQTGPTFDSLAFRQLLGRFSDVCNAVAYAHDRGVLHRDLKPGNIMLGKYGETLIVDWGIAKVVGRSNSVDGPCGGGDDATLRPQAGGDSTQTVAGAAIGTPAYMSPEQAAGRLDQLGPASDVYSLGATLYHLLTGAAPFQGDTAESLKRIQAGDFAPPRRVKPAIPPALEAVCLKAMATTAARRYASARELAEEIQRWLADEPVRAWRERWTGKLRRWAKRHRALLGSAAMLLIVATAAVFILTPVIVLHLNESRRAAEALADQKDRLAEIEAQGRREAEVFAAREKEHAVTEAALRRAAEAFADREKKQAATEAMLRREAEDKRKQADERKTEAEARKRELAGYYEDTRRRFRAHMGASRDAFDAFKQALEDPKRNTLGALTALAVLERSDADMWTLLENHDAAAVEYAGAIEVLEALRKRASKTKEQDLAMELAVARHNYAWLLTTSPDVAKRSPKLAVRLAKEALDIFAARGDFRLTYGVALYRNGDWAEAVKEITRAQKTLPKDREDDYDFDASALFLAMAEYRLRHPKDAARWLSMAQQRLSTRAIISRELDRFRKEAERLIAEGN